MDKLNLMRSFISVIEEGSFTNAASKLGKTKAVVSTHISQLEEALQVRLIMRSTRSLHLTPSGNTYYNEAKTILDSIANIEGKLRQKHNDMTGRLRISAPRTYGDLVLMPFLAELSANNEYLSTDVNLTDRFVDLIGEGFDIAIRIGHLQDSNLIARKVGECKMILCASPAFIVKYGLPKHPDELPNLPCIVDTNGRKCCKWNFWKDAKLIEAEIKGMISVSSALAAASMASNTTMMTYIPDFAAQGFIDNGTLIPLLEEYITLSIPVSSVYPHRKHLSQKVTMFTEQLQEYLSSRTHIK